MMGLAMCLGEQMTNLTPTISPDITSRNVHHEKNIQLTDVFEASISFEKGLLFQLTNAHECIRHSTGNIYANFRHDHVM